MCICLCVFAQSRIRGSYHGEFLRSTQQQHSHNGSRMFTHILVYIPSSSRSMPDHRCDRVRAQNGVLGWFSSDLHADSVKNFASMSDEEVDKVCACLNA